MSNNQRVPSKGTSIPGTISPLTARTSYNGLGQTASILATSTTPVSNVGITLETTTTSLNDPFLMINYIIRSGIAAF